jgi:hypothetical protein|tara:strand:- start:2048 stop:2605 length:558 start_codon:yes stop_codon:yes gene_type:complete
MSKNYSTQNELLLTNLLEFYNTDKNNNMDRMLQVINGESRISLRIIDWFATNYAKKYYTVYQVQDTDRRFKVYNDYKLKLKAYSKKRFDPFCRWDRISVPYKDGSHIQTTIGQLNFFKWAIENSAIDYIEQNYSTIEKDMNCRNSTSKNRAVDKNNKTRKKREELSVSASKSIKKETVEIVMKFD